MSDIVLRPYQTDFIDNVRKEMVALKAEDKKPAVVGVAPCGAGKTIMTGWMIKEAMDKGKRSIFFVHRRELIAQTAKTFSQLGIPFGIIDAQSPMNLSLPVQIASVQTLANRIVLKNGELNRKFIDALAPHFLICDECHHILANTYKKIIDAFPKAHLLGVTATPLRMGGITLHDVFNSMVESLSVKELIALGNLTSFKYFAPYSVNLKNVRTKFGEYVNRDLQREMSDRRIIGNIVEHYKKLADGKSAICYCVNVAHSKIVANAFNNAGIPAAQCDGDTPRSLREKIVDEFRRGRLKVLCNAELFGEGFDVPNMQAVILARPTKSLTLFIQQAMRPMRPDPDAPDKVAIIIDHVGNYERFGLPDDEREWSLDPNPPKNHFTPLKKCPNCGEVIPQMSRICPNCNYEFFELPEKDLHEYHGALTEIPREESAAVSKDNAKKIKRAFTKPREFLIVAKKKGYKIGWVAHQSIPYAKTYDDFVEIADVCGYKRGWAWHQWQAYCEQHQQKTLAKSPRYC